MRLRWLDHRERAEKAAVKRSCGILPEDLEARVLGLRQEFEVSETLKAKFAHAMDRSIPIIFIWHNNGQSWRENCICCGDSNETSGGGNWLRSAPELFESEVR